MPLGSFQAPDVFMISLGTPLLFQISPRSTLVSPWPLKAAKAFLFGLPGTFQTFPGSFVSLQRTTMSQKSLLTLKVFFFPPKSLPESPSLMATDAGR